MSSAILLSFIFHHYEMMKRKKYIKLKYTQELKEHKRKLKGTRLSFSVGQGWELRWLGQTIIRPDMFKRPR